MEQRPRVLSFGQPRILLYESEESWGREIDKSGPLGQKDSIASTQPSDEVAQSKARRLQPVDDHLWGDEIEPSPAVQTADRKLLAAIKYEKRNKAAMRYSNSASDYHSENDPESDRMSGPVDCSSQSSSDSSDSDDPEPDTVWQVAQAGQHFDTSEARLEGAQAYSDLDFDATDQQASPTSAAVRAPFRDGGVPDLAGECTTPKNHRIPSVITDFGESAYAKRGKTNPPTANFTSGSRKRGRRNAKQTLQERLFSELQLTYQGKRDFFPKSTLTRMITEKCVLEELHHVLDMDTTNKKTIAEYAKKICEETEFEDNGATKIRCYRKIFVILVLIEKTPAIIKFLERGINDSDLPLEKVERPNEKRVYDLRLSRKPNKRLKCFSKQWNQLHIRNFDHMQWTTLSPFFDRPEHKVIKHYPLQDQVVLPFIEILAKPGSNQPKRYLEFQGGFGRVFKVEIHPDNHNFESVDTNIDCNSFAIKTLYSPDREQFKQEVEMLKKFSSPPHPHLISLLATYEQFGSYFLIFHWAETDLQRYWMDVNPRPKMNKECVTWMIEQCTGIAFGVVKIHQYTTSNSKLQPANPGIAHHGDIKPENVLLFPDSSSKMGTLKLSDFGLANFSQHRTVSMKPRSSFATSPPYRAPELDMGGISGAIGRAYDIWTLGCLYLEFVTWLIGGWELLDVFGFRRTEPDPSMFGEDTKTFFKLVKVRTADGTLKKSAIVKPSVTKFVERELRVHKACTKFLQDFLDLIMDDLLVINAHDDKEKRGRLSSLELHSRLFAMLKECKQNYEYACDPVPRPAVAVETPLQDNDSEEYFETETVHLPEIGSSFLQDSDVRQF